MNKLICLSILSASLCACLGAQKPYVMPHQTSFPDNKASPGGELDAVAGTLPAMFRSEFPDVAVKRGDRDPFVAQLAQKSTDYQVESVALSDPTWIVSNGDNGLPKLRYVLAYFGVKETTECRILTAFVGETYQGGGSWGEPKLVAVWNGAAWQWGNFDAEGTIDCAALPAASDQG
jgi:hypothetical protein